MKIKQYYSPLILFLVTLLAGSCQLEKLQDPIIITKEIEKEFYIDLQEFLHPTDRQLRFKIRTIKDQECLNNNIATDYFSLGSKINLSINSIIPAADCQAGSAPARSEVMAGRLPNGVYDFDLALRNTVVNKGQLTIGDHSYSLKMETQEGITLLHNNLQKIPGNAFWGYVICEERQWEELEAALTELLSELARPAVYRSGYYGHFEVNNNITGTRKVFLTEPPAADFHFPMLFELDPEADESRLRALLRSFRETHPDIRLEGRNTEGRIF